MVEISEISKPRIEKEEEIIKIGFPIRKERKLMKNSH